MKLCKTIYIYIIVAVFAGQSAIACACGFAPIPDHKIITIDHHSMNHSAMNTPHDLHNCDHGCSLSAVSVDQTQLNFVYDVKTNPNKSAIIKTSSSLILLSNKHRDHQISVPIFLPFKTETSLLSQATLLLI